jgi:hypothetical protein
MLSDEEILKHYKDENFPGSAGSAKVLQVFLQSKFNEYVPLHRLYKILQSQPFYIYSIAPMRKFPRRQYDVKGYLELFQADLAEMYPKDGYKYFLLVTDIFSSKIWTIPLKSKTNADVKKAFEGLFDHLGATPTQLSTDQGNK